MIRFIPLLVLIWTGITIYLTLAPADYLPETKVFGYDKIGHFGIFGGWTFLSGLFIVYYLDRPDFETWKIWLYGVAFGAFIEFSQWALPVNRSAEVGDMVANVLGISVATYIFMRLRRNNLKKYLALER